MSDNGGTFTDLREISREDIVLGLIDTMADCDRYVITCETDCDDGTVLRLSNITGTWTREGLRAAHSNAVKAYQYTRRCTKALEAVQQLIDPANTEGNL